MKSDYVLVLVEAHLAGDRKRFSEVAAQIGHHEKRLGHAIGDRILTKLQSQTFQLGKLPSGRDSREDLFDIIAPQQNSNDLVLAEETRRDLERICMEFRHAGRLAEHGLRPIERVLFHGPPGTGKTASAEAIARLLELPLVVARHDTMISSYLGETASHLRKAFDFAAQNRAVVLFDEFDSFGRARSLTEKNDVGEMNRVVNVILQLIDRYRGPSLVIFATNLQDVLDPALARRFDATVKFNLPTPEEKDKLVADHLKNAGQLHLNGATSQAEIVRACLQEKKRRVLEGFC